MKKSLIITSKTDIVEDFKTIRKLLNMSQTVFGELIGVSGKTIARIEKDSKISKNTIKKAFFSISNVMIDNQFTFYMDEKKINVMLIFKDKLSRIYNMQNSI